MNLGKKLLTDWREANNITIYRLAKMMGTGYLSCWFWVKKDRIPTLKYAVIIEEITDGEVPCSAWEEELHVVNTVKRKNQKPKKAKTEESPQQNSDIFKGKKRIKTRT